MSFKPKSSEKRHEWFARMRGTRKVIRTLHAAIRECDVETVDSLLSKDNPELDINFEYNGNTALQLSLNESSFEISRTLLDHGADVNMCDGDGNSLVLLFAQKGHVTTVQFLIGCGADLELANKSYDTPLNAAIYNDQKEIVRLLVEAGCSTNQLNALGHSPLMISISEGLPAILQMLIDGGADVNQTDMNRKSVLQFAVENAKWDMACQIIETGCDINHNDRYGCTALWLASKEGNLQVVNRLLKAGVEIDTQDHRGATAVMEAVKAQHHQVVKRLIDARCDLNRAERDYWYTALHQAIIMKTQIHPFRDNINEEYLLLKTMMESHFAMVKLLVEADCSLSTPDKAGFTPLHQAAFGGDIDLVRLLLDHGAPTDSVTHNGDSILQLAAYGDYPDVIEQLIQAGCDVNLGNQRNEAPLYTAIDHNASVQVIDLLLKAGCKTDTKDKSVGQTPLFAAIRKGKPATVERLIQAGADVNLPNHGGDSALWVACDVGNADIVRALLQHPTIDVDQGVAHIPLHYAVLHGRTGIVRMLIDAACAVNKLTDICSSAIYFAADTNNLDLAKLLIRHGANPQAHHYVRLPQRCCPAYRDSHPHLEQEPLQAAIRNDNFHMVKVILLASPTMPYSVLGTMRDIMFRTNYARDARMTQQKIMQFGHFFAMILSQPRSLRESVRGVIRLSLGERPEQKVDNLPLPSKIKDYLLFKDSFLGDMY